MTERNLRAEFLASLLAQENTVSDSQYAEHRRKLEQKIMKEARRERIMRIATLVTGLSPLLCIPLLLILDRLPLSVHIKDVLYVILSTLTGCFLPFLLLYFLRYRRALDRARQELQETLLMELHRKVSQRDDRPPQP